MLSFCCLVRDFLVFHVLLCPQISGSVRLQAPEGRRTWTAERRDVSGDGEVSRWVVQRHIPENSCLWCLPGKLRDPCVQVSEEQPEPWRTRWLPVLMIQLPSESLSVHPAAIRSFPSHRGSASTLYTVAAIYSRIFFFLRWLCLLRNKAGRSSGIRRQRAKTATLVAACNCGSFLCSTWHKDMPKKKEHFEHAKTVNALFPCAIMTRSAASLHSLPSFVGISGFLHAATESLQNYLVTPEAHSWKWKGTEQEEENTASSVPLRE